MVLLAAPSWSVAGIHWDKPWHVSSNGQQLSVETFVSKMSVDTVVQQLAQDNHAYQRYLIADGRILLSGVDAGAHWLAEVQGDVDGAQGYVSALYFDAARESGPSFAAWLPGAGKSRAGVVPRLESSTAYSPVQVFEFDASASVALLVTSKASRVSAAEPGATVPVSGPMVPDGISTGKPGVVTLIHSEGHPAMALAVAISEH